MCKFDDDPAVKQAAFQASAELYAGLGEAERRGRLCQRVLPFILAHVESLGKQGSRRELALAVKSLVPFCCVDCDRPRLTELFRGLAGRPDCAHLQQSIVQALQLLQAE